MSRLLVRDLMTSPVVTFFEEQNLPLAEDVMRIHRFRHLPVIDGEGRLVGLVTRSDVFRGQISVLSGLTEQERRRRQADVRIGQLMARDLRTVTPDTLAADAGRTLLELKISCLPVVGDDGILCGILTERDFLKYAIVSLDETP